MVTEVMVEEMGGPRFTNVWVEMRVISTAGRLTLATASSQIPIQQNSLNMAVRLRNR
jgi:hypothetical protein